MKMRYLALTVLSFLSLIFVQAQKKHLLIQFTDSSNLIKINYRNVTNTFEVLTRSIGLNNILNRHKIFTFKKEFPSVHLVKHPKSASLDRVYRIDVADNEVYSLKNELNGLNSGILEKQIDIFEDPVPLSVPNDYSLINQANFGCSVPHLSSTYLDFINAPAAWDITTGNPNIRIAISDQNFRRTHTEILGKINSDNASAYVGGSSHGTGVAVLAAGNTNNGFGIASIGYNCKVDLINIGDYNQMLDAAINGAKVINCSWYYGCQPISSHQNLIDIIHDVYKTVIVAAAGNYNCSGPDADLYPASYNHVISVSGVGHIWNVGDCALNNNIKDVHPGDFQNPTGTAGHHNANVDLCAPYGAVAFAHYADDNSFDFFTSGTSLSSPIVAGTAALILSVNPLLTSDDVEAILKSTARDLYELKYNIPYINRLGTGRINAGAAVKLAQTWAPGSATSPQQSPTDIKWFEILSDGVNTIEVESSCAANNIPNFCNIGYRLEAVGGSSNQVFKWIVAYSENNDYFANQALTSVKYGNSIILTRGIEYPSKDVASGLLKACVRANGSVPSTYYIEDRNSSCFGSACDIPCNTDVTITGNYMTPVTESSTWIKSAGQTTIVDSKNIKLEAHPTNGYIELRANSNSDYFSSNPTTGFFIAQAYSGCTGASGVIQKVSNGEKINSSEIQNINVYPNPSSGKFIIAHSTQVKRISVSDLLGRVVYFGTSQSSKKSEINLSHLPAGIYILNIDDTIFRIVKL